MSGGVIPVLLYHSVDDHPRSDRRYAVSRADFAAHAEVVRASGREALLIDELAAGLRLERRLPERPVAITFDDGFADTYEAVEALLDRGLPSTVYATTNEIGASNRLTSQQLMELSRHPSVEVGSHGVRHLHLDELRSHELEDEIGASKARLEDVTGVGVASFSYPHGSYDRRAREAVVSARYRSAVAVKNTVSHHHDDPFAIARWTVHRGTTASRLARVLEGQGVPRAWSHERLQTRAYRVARRRRRGLARMLGASR